MQFTNDDKYLVTCGLNNPSACIIYDWQANEVVISTKVHSPTQEIFVLQEIVKLKPHTEENNLSRIEMTAEEEQIIKPSEKDRNKPKSGIVVISMHEIIIFTMREKTF